MTDSPLNQATINQATHNQTTIDEFWMRQALGLATRVKAEQVYPNPRVGAVIICSAKDGEDPFSLERILAEGFHQQYGQAHAEVNAINSLNVSAAGATMYVTLEPCNHFGKTPPCSQAVIEAGISRVVIAMADANPKVQGGGVQYLESQGIDVTLGVLEQEARAVNLHWLKKLGDA